jgi:hypothetical protein
VDRLIRVRSGSNLLDRPHDALGRRYAEPHVEAKFEELLRSVRLIQTVLAGEISGKLPDRNDVTGGNSLRITDLLLKCHDNLVRKLGAEEKITKVTDKIRMRVNIRRLCDRSFRIALYAMLLSYPDGNVGHSSNSAFLGNR